MRSQAAPSGERWAFEIPRLLLWPTYLLLYLSGVEARYRAALGRALDAGHTVLKNGGSSLDAVCAAVVVIGGVCIALALGVVSEINRPVANDILAPLVSQVHQRSPGTGVYVLIAGSTLAIISGALTLLAPRTAPPRYRYEYGPALYGAPGVLATAPYWPRERAGQDAAPTSRTSRRPPLGRRAPRSRSSGPRVPGHGRRPR